MHFLQSVQKDKTKATHAEDEEKSSENSEELIEEEKLYKEVLKNEAEKASKTQMLGVESQKRQILPFQSPQISKLFGKNLGLQSDSFSIEDKKIVPFDDKVLVIGICGGPSSGKTSLAKLLKHKLGYDIPILNQHQFYKPHQGKGSVHQHIPDSKDSTDSFDLQLTEQQLFQIRNQYNFDIPQAIDWQLMNQCLQSLLSGKPCFLPYYDMLQLKRSVL